MELIYDPHEAIQLPFYTYVQGWDGFRHEKRGHPGSDRWLLIIEERTELHGASSIEFPLTVLYKPR